MSFWIDGFMKRSGVASLLLVCFGLLGCAGGGAGPSTNGAAGGGAPAVKPYVDVLRKGDLVNITFSGSPQLPTEKEERIKEDGTVNLQFVGSIMAEGRTRGQLQKEIEEKYVPNYYKHLTVTVKTENRVFYVDGEVRQPSRLVYTGEITVLGAIASAGGFTDFAARQRIELIKVDGTKVVVDARKARDNRKLDPPVTPGDKVIVPRRGLWGR